MNKSYCLIILFITCTVCHAQNLVPNGDFEQYSACPTYLNQLYLATPWINPSMVFPDAASPDYYNQCATIQSQVSVPNNVAGHQHAHSGGAYAGIFLWRQGIIVREYIEVQLLSTLSADVCYHFEMHVNLANISRYTSDALGVHFSNFTVYGLDNLDPLPLNPQLNNDVGIFFDTLNWTLVSGDYVASGGENYLIIGNFFDDASTTTVMVNNSPSTSFDDIAYCIIDDVSLIPCATDLNEPIFGREINVYPNPFSNKLNITNNDNEISEIVIYNIASQKLFEQNFSNFTTLSTEHIGKGIYIYEVRNKKGVVKRGKMIKE